MKSDIQIQKDVVEELKWHPELKRSDIGVCCKDGVVTLSGQVATYSQKMNAEKAAKKVFGVKAVAEEIHVGVSAIDKKTDAEIADAVLNALKRNSAVQDEKIKIVVEDSYITLEGEADSEYQRSQAKKSLEFLPGIKGVFNMITIKPAAGPDDIKHKIESAFQRSAFLDAKEIQVSVNHNKVTLQGTVRSIHEKENAELAVWGAPGIVAVENKLEVEMPEYAH
jgi:osmotically-inducible protein OsmY